VLAINLGTGRKAMFSEGKLAPCILLFREKPWYLSSEPLSLHQCPCGCGVVVVAIAPELPYMGWPDIKGGKFAQQSAREQVEKLHWPYIEQLMSDPRNKLPLPRDGVIQPASGCGLR
jgi:hypothetical protein